MMDEPVGVWRKDWAKFLRNAAKEARELGKPFALIDPAECNLIANHLDAATTSADPIHQKVPATAFIETNKYGRRYLVWTPQVMEGCSYEPLYAPNPQGERDTKP